MVQIRTAVCGMRRLTVTTTEASRDYLDLDMALLWGPEGAGLVAEVFGAVEDGSVVRREGDGAHGGWQT